MIADASACRSGPRVASDMPGQTIPILAASGTRLAKWEQAYLCNSESHLPEQFLHEARASLPPFSTDAAGDIFASVCLQRIRLRHDQQVPEWEGGS